MADYIFKGSKQTSERLRGMECDAVRRRRDGKTVRGRNGNMLVRFVDGTLGIVPGRLLRKIKPTNEQLKD